MKDAAIDTAEESEKPASASLPAAGDPAPRGLTTAEAACRLAADGFNELPEAGQRTILGALKDVLSEPMFLLLIGAAGIYFLIGDRREALVLLASIFIVVGITLMQERRTERTLTKLRDLSSPRALVIRDGAEQRIPGREVVVGDLVLLHEGDRVPADGRIVSTTALTIDESIVTGESLPVEKTPAPTDVAPSADAAASRAYSGTLITSGFGTLLVTATGERSEIGRIGKALAVLAPEPTPLLREVRRIVRWMAAAGLLFCAVIAVIFALSRGDWLGGVLAGITVAMGLLPEEFPVVLTVFLAMGAWRISKRGVLTRRMPAIETIGSATVLAVDKTGTLTENRMKVAVIVTTAAHFDLRVADVQLDDAAATVLGTALAASERDAFDPMERAIHAAAAEHVAPLAAALEQLALVREYDLTPELLAVTHVWETGTGREVTVKGAPETVFTLCHLPPDEREHWLDTVRKLATQGLRVLGVARGGDAGESLPDSPTGFTLEFLGLLCLADPVREEVPAALAECASAGIRVVMITGDHPGTALAIGGQAGLDTRGGAMTGAELETLTDDEIRQRVATTNIYARAKPEHKLRLIEALKANGEIVVMTGDGVNDAPALKAAHVGVAMGSRGTDVAREAAALVLVNDDFASLVGAVRLGRRIYDNIRHAMTYLLAVHLPIAGMGLLPVLFGWPLVLFPLHVLFMEFVIDPACSLVFEADPEDRELMRRPPRAPRARLFSPGMLRLSVVVGTVALLYTIIVYTFALRDLPEEEARALAFAAMVIANLLLIFVARTHQGHLLQTLARPNPVFWWITGLALAALGLTIYVPQAATLFGFAAPPFTAILAVMLAASVVLLPALLRGRLLQDDGKKLSTPC